MSVTTIRETVSSASPGPSPVPARARAGVVEAGVVEAGVVEAGPVDPPGLDRAAQPRRTDPRQTPARRVEAADVDPSLTHLLRLSLDLQLDALLFILGAAATHPDDPATDEVTTILDLESGQGEPQLAMPWRTWMAEDLELSRCLASTAVGLGLTLPPTLGRAGRHEDSRQVADDLIARYEFMANLLDDLLERAAVSTPRTLLEPVADALVRTRRRLEQLREATAPARA